MRKISIVCLLIILASLSYGFHSQSQTLVQRIEAGRTYLNEVVEPQTLIFTESDQYIEGITYHKKEHVEYMELSVKQIANSKIPTLQITNKDYLWKSYLTLLNFPSGTPVRFYHREMVLSEVNDSIPLADYLIPVVINP
ncbi:MAG: hypothetical protein HYX21_02740 [Candidatus Yanofskybacteria bacterium]|nr:hypothetical protein [Candidatus Yanofskybacteria bacterium]